MSSIPSVLFLGAVLVPTSLYAAAVVGSPHRLWPSHTIDYIVCDQSIRGTRRDLCEPQAGKGSRQAFLLTDEARLIRATTERWNQEFGSNLRLREVTRARATSTLVFRASSRPTRCSTQGVGFSPRQRLKFISIGTACTPGAPGRQTNTGTVALACDCTSP